MIDDVLRYVRIELRDRLGVADAQIMIESARVLANQDNLEGAYITLVNVEEEPTLRNTPVIEREGATLQRREPAIHLNLYLLFSFEFQNYETSLSHLSNTIGLFQEKCLYTAANESATNALPDGLVRLRFEIFNMSFEALNNLWGVMGGAYFPSIVYKVSIVAIQSSVPDGADEITTIAFDVVTSTGSG